MIRVSDTGVYTQNERGEYVPAIPEPFYWGLLPWIKLRLTGYRDEYGRKAQFIGWRD
jgi:hypothetical protein